MKTNEIFKKIREEAGLSQVMLSQMIGATQGAISAIENSENSNPTYEVVSKYITEVGANPVFLFGMDPKAPPIIHPTILKARISGAADPSIKNEIIKDLEATVKKLRKL